MTKFQTLLVCCQKLIIQQCVNVHFLRSEDRVSTYLHSLNFLLEIAEITQYTNFKGTFRAFFVSPKQLPTLTPFNSE